VGERAGLLVLAGMELCTSEDIHVLCLFAEISGALAFEKIVKSKLPQIKNRPKIFGDQLFIDEMDNITGTEDTLLATSADIGVNKVLALCRKFGGTAFPAHADRSANGIIQILGAIPPEAGFVSAELSGQCEKGTFVKKNNSLCGLKILSDSDAHYLWQINERQNSLRIGNRGSNAIISHIDCFGRENCTKQLETFFDK
jgi:hypothetical protein